MKIMSVVGARPQFIKAASFRKGCVEQGIEEILFHTGQHYDFNMSNIFFEQLDVNPPELTYDLKNRGHGSMTGELLAVLEASFLEHRPDIVNVYGDTNTTIAAALAASKLHIPVSHIEAGLRSFNKKMPEEINRVLTDHTSQFLFCPTQAAVQNLKNENITEGVFHVGDIMNDSVKLFRDKFLLPEVVIRNTKSKKVALLTIHRAENVNDRAKLKEILDYCRSYLDDYFIVFTVHPNTRNKLKEFGMSLDGFNVVEPLPYLELQGLISLCDLILTDSGGVQKEAYFHRVPCVTLREETEWVETVSAGWNKLWKSKEFTVPRKLIDEYGNGDTTARIIEKLQTL